MTLVFINIVKGTPISPLMLCVSMFFGILSRQCLQSGLDKAIDNIARYGAILSMIKHRMKTDGLTDNSPYTTDHHSKSLFGPSRV